MRGDLFVHETTKVASVFGRKSNVKVTFKGDGAYTNGKDIVLPSINLNGNVSDKTVAITRGYLDHEAGHIRHTDFDALRVFAGDAASQGKKLVRTIHNVLEDIWLEKRVMAEYAGSRKNLVAVSEAVNQQFLDTFSAPNEDDLERLGSTVKMCCAAISFEGRRHYGGKTCEPCLDLLSDPLRAQAKRWVSKLDDCDCTQDVIDLAWAVEKEVFDGLAPDPKGGDATEDGEASDDGDASGDGDEQQEGNEDDNGSSGEDSPTQGGEDDADTSEEDNGDGSDDGETSDTSENGSDVSDEPDAGSEEGDDTDDGETEGRSAADNVERDCDDVYDPRLDAAVEKALADDVLLPDTGSGNETYFAASTESDKWHHRLDASDKYPDDQWGTGFANRGHDLLSRGEASDYEAVLIETAGVTNSMRRRLERALMAKQTRDWNGGMEAGRLDTRRLVSAYGGNDNVFKVQTDRKEMDTALTLLVDLSGSMSCGDGSKIDLANKAVIAIVEAVARTGIVVEVLGFSNVTDHIVGVGLDPAFQWNEDGSDYAYGKSGQRVLVKAHRLNPLDMWIFKAYSETLNECKGALSALAKCGGGCNSDGEALALAHARMVARPEKRKVMMVLSDGMPQCSGNLGLRGLRNHLIEVVADIKRSGTEVIAIGIQDDAVSRFYGNYCVVNDLEELSGTALDMLSKLLLGEARRNVS